MKKWDRAAMCFKSAEYAPRPRMLGVTFENGDRFLVATETLLPAPNGAVGRRDGGRGTLVAAPDWPKLRIGATGDVLEVPVHGGVIEIPWDRIRALADPEFRAHLSERAGERTRRLGARIRTLRLEAAMTRSTLASRLGLSRESLAKLEAGKTAPALELIERIAQVLNIPLRDFAKES
jgi:putative transcriptional regulator